MKKIVSLTEKQASYISDLIARKEQYIATTRETWKALKAADAEGHEAVMAQQRAQSLPLEEAIVFFAKSVLAAESLDEIEASYGEALDIAKKHDDAFSWWASAVAEPLQAGYIHLVISKIIDRLK